MDPNQFISMLDQQGQIGQVVEEVRRRKALAGVLETASIVDTQGNPVDLSALEDDEEADGGQAEAGSEESAVEADEQTEDAAASK